MKVAIKNGAELTVSSVESLKAVNDYAKSNKIIAKVHLKVDTGMSRFGFNDFKEFKTALKLVKKCEFISVNGVYSHFYDSDDETLEKQYVEFEKYRLLALKCKIKPIFHMASSSVLANKKYQFDMVRLGIDLYLSENHSFETNILQIKNLKAGDKVGYGGTFKAQKNMKIAVCGAGYADGVCRKLSVIGSVLIGDKIVPIVGRICMDCFMVDVSNIDAKVGDKVLIFGKMRENYISVCEVAHKCDTIPYEIYTNISSRVKRVYWWGDYAGNFRKI